MTCFVNSMMHMMVMMLLSVVGTGSSDGCWSGQFSASYCCKGRGGRSECWDSLHNFETCCADYLKTSHPFGDLLLTHENAPLFDPDQWGNADGDPVTELHRRCLARGGPAKAPADCSALEVKAAEKATLPEPETQYVGVHHRLALRRYPFTSFVSQVHDLFYKAKTFPAEFWGSDDFALFEAGFRTYLRCGDVAVDAGGNIGGYTQMLALSVCASGRLHTFEPFRLTFQMLNANVALAGLVNVHTYHRALSNKPGRSRAVGTDVRDPGQQTIWNSLIIPREKRLQNEGGMLWEEEEAEDEEIIHMTLDSLQLPRLDFMKIDVEAMEAHVLLGAAETIARCHPAILVEIKGFQRGKLHTYFAKDLGYECWSVLSTNPSDFLCVHPVRQQRDPEGVARLKALWTTPLAFEHCVACRRREPAPVEVDGVS